MAEKSLMQDVPKAENASASNLNYKLPKSSFLDTKEYSQLLKSQNKLHSQHFVLIYQNTNSPDSKLGYSLSKKNIPLAVKRNLCRRIIKEGFRQTQHSFPGKLVLIIVKKSARNVEKRELRQCLEPFWKKLAGL
ncbi:MAG: Ribonuclease protein component [Gammaproteobacteria bacterium]|jgi:ribonuclease P protein component|nr:Ribonuclease protein component [Gammaproteobacteria bacterium]